MVLQRLISIKGACWHVDSEVHNKFVLRYIVGVQSLRTSTSILWRQYAARLRLQYLLFVFRYIVRLACLYRDVGNVVGQLLPP